MFATASPALQRAKAILMNTFEEFEKSTLTVLNHDRIIEGLPPLLPIISLVDEYDDHDEETKSENVRELLGDSVWHENGRRGMVMKSWVDQDEVLASSSIGGFVSHCGWNSVTEAMWAGVPVLAWPHRGDQRVNAQVVEESGLGVWMKEWGMGTRSGLVNGEEIGEKIGEFMRDENLRERLGKSGKRLGRPLMLAEAPMRRSPKCSRVFSFRKLDGAKHL
ncbi:UDP-glycosyltransferase 13-like [Punica granatum]|uniref:UDP-glycosyltransferase 13-like n=1 Tax=Punica granatum TaxID=22663 RepID=A0A6P8C1U3_PUNGR|nr:UDP-glycosyltransferase 13-like [Punica granatum]